MTNTKMLQSFWQIIFLYVKYLTNQRAREIKNWKNNDYQIEYFPKSAFLQQILCWKFSKDSFRSKWNKCVYTYYTKFSP